MDDSYKSLSALHCEPDFGPKAILSEAQRSSLLLNIPSWNTLNNKALRKEIAFRNFGHAVKYIEKIRDIAEREKHFPDIYLHDEKFLTITLSSPHTGGLTKNDCIIAAKIDSITQHL